MAQTGNVNVCPATKEAWEERAEAKKGDCGGYSVYHCLSDNEDRKWERCVEKSLIKEGNCPIFTKEGFIDWKPCNISIPSCPTENFFSDEVYKYPRCLGKNSLPNKIGVDNIEVDDFFPLALSICISLLLLSSVLTLLIWIQRSRLNFKAKQDHKESQKLVLGQISEKIVKENNVKNGISLLLKEEVRSIVVVGKFGNLVSSTSRSISKKFQEMRKWKTIEYRYTDIPETVEENTIIFVHGWFGMWNDDLCSVDKVKTACQSLVRILNETKNVKLILGMRSDLKQKYHEELHDEVDDRDTSLVHYEINLDSGGNVHKDEENVRYINNYIKKACKKSDCDCKHLECEMFRRGKDKVVGIPLKISVIEKYHELVPNYIHNLDILKVMKDHFAALENDREKKYVYEWIVYICLKGKFSRSEPFDTNLVHEMRFEIEKFSFNENDKELSRYIRMRNSDKLRNVTSENAGFVFWHPFIYICAFHYLFHKDPELVMKHCSIDAILQLARPKEFKTSYFEVAADDRWVTLFRERIRLLGIQGRYSQHPLVQEHRELWKQFEINSGMNFTIIPHLF